MSGRDVTSIIYELVSRQSDGTFWNKHLKERSGKVNGQEKDKPSDIDVVPRTGCNGTIVTDEYVERKKLNFRYVTVSKSNEHIWKIQSIIQSIVKLSKSSRGILRKRNFLHDYNQPFPK